MGPAPWQNNEKQHALLKVPSSGALHSGGEKRAEIKCPVNRRFTAGRLPFLRHGCESSDHPGPAGWLLPLTEEGSESQSHWCQVSSPGLTHVN